MDLGALSIGTVVAIVSAFASLIAIIVSIRTARAQHALALHLAEEEHLLLFEQVRMQRDSDVIRWTKECVSVLSACENYVEFFEPYVVTDSEKLKHQELSTHLSALIDEGRLYFPNEAPDSKGQKKPIAYRGERQLILTILVRVYDLFKKTEEWGPPENRDTLLKSFNDLRRLYVSEAQLAIDPRRYIALKEMNELKRVRGVDEQLSSEEQSLRKSLIS